jgi:membrane protease subunit HflK
MNRGLLLLLILLVGYLATGIYQVLPGQWAVVRRCGAPLTELRGPGLHIGMPWGFDRVDRVTVDEQRLLHVGYVEDSGPGDSLAPLTQASPTGQALTGDNQIVNVRLSVLYRVDQEQLIRFVTLGTRVEEQLERLAEETLTSTLASERIDLVLLGRAVQLENRLRERMMERVKHYKLGLLIDSVNLVQAQPPSELAEVFREVNRARTQRDIIQTEATARRNADLSQARQFSSQTRSAAEAYQQTRLTQSKSEAQAFRALLANFPTTEPAASQALLQLYLTEMQSILARMQVRTLSDQGVEQIILVPLPTK